MYIWRTTIGETNFHAVAKTRAGLMRTIERGVILYLGIIPDSIEKYDQAWEFIDKHFAEELHTATIEITPGQFYVENDPLLGVEMELIDENDPDECP